MLKRLGTAASVLALLGVALSTASAQNKNRNLVVMSRNLDTGSDYNLVLKATSPTEVLLAVAATYKEIVDSNIPERADAIAAEIQQQQPDLFARFPLTQFLLTFPRYRAKFFCEFALVSSQKTAFQLFFLHRSLPPALLHI